MNDNDISMLIKEAKPLYFARKRRNNVMKSVGITLLCIGFINLFSSSSGYIYDYDGLNEEIYLTENGSVIQEMGLPVDEYGLLKVV